jgi:hypothetical protein
LDLAGRIYQAAVSAAVAGDDLEMVLPALVRITRSRGAVLAAVSQCDDALTRTPGDLVARRAREMLLGALGTSLFGDDDGHRR